MHTEDGDREHQAMATADDEPIEESMSPNGEHPEAAEPEYEAPTAGEHGSDATPRAAADRLRQAIEQNRKAVSDLRADAVALSDEIRQIRDQPAGLIEELGKLRSALAETREQVSANLEALSAEVYVPDEVIPEPEAEPVVVDEADQRRGRLFHRGKRPRSSTL
jgi:hypothetical protein